MSHQSDGSLLDFFSFCFRTIIYSVGPLLMLCLGILVTCVLGFKRQGGSLVGRMVTCSHTTIVNYTDECHTC